MLGRFIRRGVATAVGSRSAEPGLRPANVPAALGAWYHRLELPDGTVTPGDRDQTLVYRLYEPHLPAELTGLRVLDLGANACGLAIEFAKRGATVTAVDSESRYLYQAQWVLETFGLEDRVELITGSVYS